MFFSSFISHPLLAVHYTVLLSILKLAYKVFPYIFLSIPHPDWNIWVLQEYLFFFSSNYQPKIAASSYKRRDVTLSRMLRNYLQAWMSCRVMVWCFIQGDDVSRQKMEFNLDPSSVPPGFFVFDFFVPSLQWYGLSKPFEFSARCLSQHWPFGTLKFWYKLSVFSQTR